MQRESTDFVKFLVCLILSPSVPVSLSDIKSSISEGRKKQIVAQMMSEIQRDSGETPAKLM